MAIRPYVSTQTHRKTETLTSIFSLQDFLKVFEGTGLFGFRGRLLIVLQHLVDIWLYVKTISANRGVDRRLWAEGNKQSKTQYYWKAMWLILNMTGKKTSISFSNQSRQHKRNVFWCKETRRFFWNMTTLFFSFTRWCHDVTFGNGEMKGAKEVFTKRSMNTIVARPPREEQKTSYKSIFFSYKLCS